MFKNIITIVSVAMSALLYGADVNLSLDGSNLNYESTSDIYGIQFGHDGCAIGAAGGDAASNGFTVSASNSVVLGFSFSGG